jgi:hypothetical protein
LVVRGAYDEWDGDGRQASEGGERVGMKVDGWAVERDGKTDSSKTT